MKDRRRAKRYAVPEERQATTLKVGDESFPARMVDESALGFSVWLDGHPGAYEGEKVWMQHVAGWTTCRVVLIQAYPGGCRLGLERVDDIGRSASRADDELTKSAADRRRIRNTVPLIIGIALLIAWLAVPLVRHGRLDFGGFLATFTERPSTRNAHQGDVFDEDEIAVVEHLIRKSDAMAFASPEVANVLKLTPAQSRRLAEIGRKAERVIDYARRSGAKADYTQELRRQAESESMAVLSPAQRARWNELVKIARKRAN